MSLAPYGSGGVVAGFEHPKYNRRPHCRQNPFDTDVQGVEYAWQFALELTVLDALGV